MRWPAVSAGARSMIGLLLGLIDPISRIAGKIADAKTAQANAQTDREKIAADERVKALEARKSVMMAEAGGRVNQFMRAAMALGPMLYLNKIFIWDKVLGGLTGGRTDPIDANLWNVIIAVVGFYFLYDIAARLRR
jgi:hypothetical protein